MSLHLCINKEVTEEKERQIEAVPPIAAPMPPIPESSIVNFRYIYLENKGLKIVIAIIAVLSLLIIAGLVWYIFRLNDDTAKTKREKDDLELEISDFKGNIQELTTSNLGLLANITQLQADNTELIDKNRKLVANMTELQTKYDIQENILDNYKRNMYDLLFRDLLLNNFYFRSACETTEQRLNISLENCKNEKILLRHSESNPFLMKAEITEIYQEQKKLKVENDNLHAKNSEMKTNIINLKNENMELKDQNIYLMDYRIYQNTKLENEQKKQKSFLLNLKDISQSEQNKNILLQ